MAKRTVEELVEAALIDLVLDFPVFAFMATRIGVHVVDEEEDFLAYTDGKGIYLNKRKIEELNANPTMTGKSGKVYNVSIQKDELIFIICHELFHMIGLTWDRGETKGIYRGQTDMESRYKHDLWNRATDYEINSMLVNNKEVNTALNTSAAKPVGRMPAIGLYDEKYKDMLAEDIYEDLLKQNQSTMQQMQALDQAIKDASGDGSSSKNGNGEEDTEGNQDNNGNPVPGNTKDGLGVALDKHMPFENEIVKNEVLTKLAEAVANANNSKSSSALERVLNKVFEPVKFNWRRALQKYISKFVKSNFSWNKPSRVGIANGLILPNVTKTPRLHLAVSIDTSGSVGNRELQLMLSHIFSILNQFKEFTVDVWCCSTIVHEETFTRYTKSNIHELSNQKIASNGGTDLKHNFTFIKEKYKSDKPDAFILMSDFYDDISGSDKVTCNIPCVWMVVDNDRFVPPTRIKADTYPFNI